jgi:flavin-dependent dehydrogenase
MAMQTADRSHHDVVVVGGRVAGSATAMLLARLGHDVVVVDQATFPSDTVSTHSIARSGVVQLRRWGLLDEVLDSGAPAIRQVTFNAGGESTSRTIKDKAGVDFLVAPRRYVLDTILASAAEHAGAQLRPGVTVTGVERDGRGRVVGVHGHDLAGAPVELGARWVIGADGLRSRVAGLVGAAINEVRRAGGAAQYAYYAGIRWAGIEFFVAEWSFAGVFPTHHGQACIWVCNPSADAKAVRRGSRSRVEAFEQLLERSAPPLAERLGQARRTSPVQGMVRQPNQLRQAFGPGWALVGDAGYYRDAVTAYGISDAFHHAELLAAALDRRWVPPPRRRPRPWRPISSTATRRCGRSSSSPAAWRPIRRCRPSSSSRSS